MMNYGDPHPFSFNFDLLLWTRRANEPTQPANVLSLADLDIPSVRNRVAPTQLPDCFKTTSAFG